MALEAKKSSKNTATLAEEHLDVDQNLVSIAFAELDPFFTEPRPLNRSTVSTENTHCYHFQGQPSHKKVCGLLPREASSVFPADH
jgi:hypothetical protein